MTALFIAFLALMVAIIVTLIAHYLNKQTAVIVLAAICLWFIYATLLGYLGVLKNTAIRPPGIAFLLFPTLVFLLVVVVLVVRLPASARLAVVVPLWIILGIQCFRIAVELFLYQLWNVGLVPRMLTFDGANVDIYFGVSAPLIAWLSTRGRFGLQIALAWSALGILSVANVVTRAVLTSPGPLNLIHAEVPNRILSTLPFLFIPGFLVPLAVSLHVLAIRIILIRLRTPPPDAVSSDRGRAPKPSTANL